MNINAQIANNGETGNEYTNTGSVATDWNAND